MHAAHTAMASHTTEPQEEFQFDGWTVVKNTDETTSRDEDEDGHQSNHIGENDGNAFEQAPKLFSPSISNVMSLSGEQKLNGDDDGHSSELPSNRESVTVSAEDANTCEICGKSFDERRQLNGHKRFAHQEIKSKIECNACGKRMSMKKLRLHKIHHRHDNDYSVIEVTKPSGENELTYKCNLCGITFCSKSVVVAHLRTINKTSRCAGRSLAYKSSMFSCDICGDSFTERKRLNYHRAVHKRKFKSIECDVCGKTFRYWSRKDMVAHKARHKYDNDYYIMEETTSTGEIKARYKCRKCGRDYSDKGGVFAHLKKKHKPYYGPYYYRDYYHKKKKISQQKGNLLYSPPMSTQVDLQQNQEYAGPGTDENNYYSQLQSALYSPMVIIQPNQELPVENLQRSEQQSGQFYQGPPWFSSPGLDNQVQESNNEWNHATTNMETELDDSSANTFHFDVVNFEQSQERVNNEENQMGEPGPLKTEPVSPDESS